MILWTRLVRAGLPHRRVEVDWQVAHDPRFRRIALAGAPWPARSWPTRCTSTPAASTPAGSITTASGRWAGSARWAAPAPRRPAGTTAGACASASVSSDFPIEYDAPLKAVNPTLNPHVRYFDGSRRGYLRCVVNRAAWHTDVRAVATIDVPVSPVTTSASYVVEAGRSMLNPG